MICDYDHQSKDENTSKNFAFAFNLTFNMMKLSVKTLIIKLLTRFDVLKHV